MFEKLKSDIAMLKGGIVKMARTLTAKKEETPAENPATPSPPETKGEQSQVRIVSFETIILNEIDALNAKVDNLTALLVEGFRQCEVKFPEAPKK